MCEHAEACFPLSRCCPAASPPFTCRAPPIISPESPSPSRQKPHVPRITTYVTYMVERNPCSRDRPGLSTSPWLHAAVYAAAASDHISDVIRIKRCIQEWCPCLYMLAHDGSSLLPNDRFCSIYIDISIYTGTAQICTSRPDISRGLCVATWWHPRDADV